MFSKKLKIKKIKGSANGGVTIFLNNISMCHQGVFGKEGGDFDWILIRFGCPTYSSADNNGVAKIWRKERICEQKSVMNFFRRANSIIFRSLGEDLSPRVRH